ncbi:LemA family protein [Candidatus Clostridium radicumherbarum]|uniref:LemA family protein n=1 Tax=Candidatus Clostridium radicumherbarum TaxID=3381662 RepID=A0ABW8TQV6_9CLOT
MQYAIIIIAALIILYLIGGYNSLVRLRNYVNESWSQIDAQLKRRYDLIPNLIETVKGYMNYEEKVLTEIVQARSMLLSGNKEEAIDANNMISQSLKSLFAVSEAYPDLKANKNFLLLQEELSGTENKIAYARKHYNEVVRQYNTKVEMFPSNIIAGIFGFQKNVYFEVKEEEKEVPKVQF